MECSVYTQCTRNLIFCMPPLLKKSLKIGVGVFLIPLAFLTGKIWPWWQEQPLPVKIISAPFVLPVTGVVFVVSFWYNDL